MTKSLKNLNDPAFEGYVAEVDNNKDKENVPSRHTATDEITVYGLFTYLQWVISRNQGIKMEVKHRSITLLWMLINIIWRARASDPENLVVYPWISMFPTMVVRKEHWEHDTKWYQLGQSKKKLFQEMNIYSDMHAIKFDKMDVRAKRNEPDTGTRNPNFIYVLFCHHVALLCGQHTVHKGYTQWMLAVLSMQVDYVFMCKPYVHKATKTWQEVADKFFKRPKDQKKNQGKDSVDENDSQKKKDYVIKSPDHVFDVINGWFGRLYLGKTSLRGSYQTLKSNTEVEEASIVQSMVGNSMGANVIAQGMVDHLTLKTVDVDLTRYLRLFAQKM